MRNPYHLRRVLIGKQCNKSWEIRSFINLPDCSDRQYSTARRMQGSANIVAGSVRRLSHNLHISIGETAGYQSPIAAKEWRHTQSLGAPVLYVLRAYARC